MLKVSHWKGIIWFGKRIKKHPRYIGPLKILARIGPIEYKLKLPQVLKNVHNVFHVSNVHKCLSDETLSVPINETQVNIKLPFARNQ